ncbi:DUF4249 family protein [Flagellimonas pacifica]|uniref:DUF4249 domain-containing protein n=1 Tax=Flagellimonas pacifica TaxID=1247520 RepID=A0A285MVS3_9FLAO|nr:DUF4249 family protein [Allomuricauda parva]SNZ00637.1 protein of unknown function [Allomuricauda parva]
MKNSLFVLIALWITTSCEDAINVDLPSPEARLVIDALLGFNENNGNPITVGQVKLTLTAPFLQEEIPPAENASVSIIDDQTGQIFELQENEPGVFSLGLPDIEFNKDYTLMVNYNNEVYTATQHLMSSSLIDNLEQGDDFLFDEDEETEVKVSFTDILGEPNHYLFSFGFGNFLVIEDEFFEDSQLTFSYFYENVDPGDLLTVTLFGIDKEFADYVSLALVQSGEDGGGPFATPPASVRGNIINTTNPKNFPFGYFALSEYDTKTITIE